jgi:multicomponent Na+:H+ antiporter subunit E
MTRRAVVAGAALGALWVLLTGGYTLGNALVGVAMGLVLVRLARDPRAPTALGALDDRLAWTARRAWACVGLFVFFVRELVVANVRMAYYTIMPLSRIRPGIVAVPLEPMSDAAVTLLANLITLTPGTLSVELSPDRRTLYVHAMEVDDPAAVVREIKTGFERRVREVMR